MWTHNDRPYNVADLQRFYKRFNRIYWGGRLPDATIKFCRLYTTAADCSTPHGKPPVIRFHLQLRFWQTVCIQTLLHEMCHVATASERAAHGKRFQQEILWLKNRGAFDKLL